MSGPRKNRAKRGSDSGSAKAVVLSKPAKQRGRTWLLVGLIVAVVFVAFYPSLGNGFNYDDERNILDNRDYRGLGLANLRWMFTTFLMGHYQPLSWMTLGLDYIVWGKKPWGYHFTNLVLHAANAVLVFFLARRLFQLTIAGPAKRGAIQAAIDLGALIAALLFAVHPLRVESVAWVTERRDVLSSLFLLVTVLLYLRAHTSTASTARRRMLIAAVVTFVLSLLSRAMGVTLPLILLVLDIYPLKRLGGGRGRCFGPDVRHVWIEKIPFIILAAIAAILAPIAQHDAGATIELARHGVVGRLAQACYGVVFYLHKSLLPLDLSPIYELWLPLSFRDPRYYVSAIFALILAITLVRFRRRYPAVVTAAVCYLVLLLPVLGFVQSGVQEVADRYSYLPMIGWAIVIGGGLALLLDKLSKGPDRLALVSAAALLVFVLSVLTWQQCLVWRTPLTLWTHAAHHSRPGVISCSNLACALAKDGQKEAALVQFCKALEYNSVLASVHYNYGNTLNELGRTDEAIREYRRTLELDPTYGRAHYELGHIYGEQRRFKEAKEEYQTAIRVSKSLHRAYINLGVILDAQEHNPNGAMELYRKALALRPNHRDAHYNMAIALDAVGKTDEAIFHYQETIRSDPGFPDAHVNLGNLLARKGRVNEAIAEYRDALRIAPNHPAAKANLEGWLRQQNRQEKPPR
jgi:tetratricopeptide (TPR) repeat protein